MSKPIPSHGTTARYRGRKDLPGCRCRSCTTAATRADAERKLARLSGNPRSAEPETIERVLSHLRYLVANDMSHEQIGQCVGVAQSTVSQLLSGQRKKLMSSTACKLLQARPADRTETCMVSAVGAMRRLQALYWMGHSSQVLSDETGLHHDTVRLIARGFWEKTTEARAQAVRRTYDKLAMQYGNSDNARRFAAKYNWHGPLAWDDDTIDDPRAVPQTDAFQPVATEGGNVAARWLMGEAVILGRDDRREVLAHLFEWTNQTTAEIAERLDMRPEAAERQWHRIKQRAAAEGRRVWRRVYEPREQTLTQNEMEEAA
jgi:transcriptional regulator with XRE-family HTH domain